jgi:acetyltransferase-like isoleucine patch superfamily enzyme
VSFIDWLDDGKIIPSKNGFKARLSARIGYRRAAKRQNVIIDKSCLISPSAKINARTGQIQIGKNSMVSSGAVIQGNVIIGCNSSVQSNTMLVGYGTKEDRTGEIRIGDNVRIAPQVMIIGANHIFSDPDKLICQQGMERKSIIIEDDVWVAGRVNIMAGVKIGKGSVIAAGAVVSKDVPPYSVVAGVPAKVIKQRKSEESGK